jgi:hypothetical protein
MKGTRIELAEVDPHVSRYLLTVHIEHVRQKLNERSIVLGIFSRLRFEGPCRLNEGQIGSVCVFHGASPQFISARRAPRQSISDRSTSTLHTSIPDGL